MGVIETQGFQLDNTGRRIVVDPVTRIEGHMRCEVNVDKDNIIRNAVSTGTMWRGLEVILKGRDPRDAWAFVERICGVCTGCHALTSVRAVEDALGIRIPLNAHLIREMMAKTLQVHDHAVHFYHLHALDWVDVISALKADPKKTSELQQLVSPSHPLSSPGYFRDIQTRLKKFVESGQLGPFMNGYWGSKAYVLPPEANLMAVTHYLEALDLQKEWVKVHTIFGGKNPHPNYLVGGVVPTRQGTAHPNIVPYQVMPAADGYFMLAVGNDAQYARLCEVLGAPSLASDPRYATNAARVAHRAELVPLLQAHLRTRPAAEWLDALDAVKVPANPVNRIDQVFDDPQVRARGLRIELAHASGRDVPMVRNPAQFSATPLRYGAAAPVLGQHTRAVLAELLGIDEATLATLQADGVIQAIAPTA